MTAVHTLDEAVAALTDLGLVAEVVGGRDGYILGGTSRADDGPVPVYQDTFQIRRGSADRSGDWEVTVTGPGQFDTERRAPSLAGAVDTVHHIITTRRRPGQP